MKSIELRLPEWVNFVTQDKDGTISLHEEDPGINICDYFFSPGAKHIVFSDYFSDPELGYDTVCILNWRESKINVNTESFYIDEHGILRKMECI